MCLWTIQVCKTISTLRMTSSWEFLRSKKIATILRTLLRTLMTREESMCWTRLVRHTSKVNFKDTTLTSWLMTSRSKRQVGLVQAHRKMVTQALCKVCNYLYKHPISCAWRSFAMLILSQSTSHCIWDVTATRGTLINLEFYMVLDSLQLVSVIMKLPILLRKKEIFGSILRKRAQLF